MALLFQISISKIEIKGGFKSEDIGGFLLFLDENSKSLSWAENLDFPPKSVNNLFKFSAQDSDLEYLFWQAMKKFFSIFWL